jgi:hypothetical protein
MKLIIAGGRDYKATEDDFLKLDQEFKHQVTEEVCGCAAGADTAGETWAKRNNIPIKYFPAEWNIFGKSAGYRRNVSMAEYADAVVVFPGGMVTIAKQKGLKVYDWRTNYELCKKRYPGCST